MRTIISLSALGLTLALGGAAVANPLDRSAGFGKEQMQTYRLHKRIYAHDQKRSVVTDRLQERRENPSVGTASTAGGKPGRG
jgi:hypothetical protein